MAIKGFLKRLRFKPPAHTLGADLFWWRETGDLHTLVTIYPPVLAPAGTDLMLTFVLFDADGTPRARWTCPMRSGHPIAVDSRRIEAIAGAPVAVTEGTLAAFVSAATAPDDRLTATYSRLYSLVDWISDDGELVSLHNDQSVVNDEEEAIEFTEIIVEETPELRSYLVLLNGDERQEAGSVTVEIENDRGDTRQAVYHPAMEPYTVHRLVLAELFDDLVAFGDGQPMTLAGVFNCRGLFTRPYVMTEGERLSGYHGGNRYDWDGLPAIRYEHLGHGQMNPMAVVETDELSTVVNIFNTHGRLEEDFWIDACVYDEAGHLIARRDRWLLARRHGLARGAIRDLLPPETGPVKGYVALTYTPHEGPLYPGTVQALMEYRTAHNVSRVMAWADEWNSPDRLAAGGATLRAFYRVLCDDRVVSHLAISNCGLTPDYDVRADYAVVLTNGRRETLRYEGVLDPHATIFAPIDAFFPTVRDFLGDDPAAVAVVESRYDLAIVQFGRHRRSGVWCAEHAMSLFTFHEGKVLLPCGS